MPNKAFGIISGIATDATLPPRLRFEYSVINPSNGVVRQQEYAYAQVEHTDNPYDVWAKIVSQCRSQMGDPDLIVVNSPSSLDFLMYERAY